MYTLELEAQATKGKVKNCITVNSNDVIGDNLWVWRADHGDNVAWDKNTAKKWCCNSW